MTEPLVLSIGETAELLGVSDDLVYDLVAQGDLPCLRLGRRRVIPRIAIERVVNEALADFDAGVVHDAVSRRNAADQERERAMPSRSSGGTASRSGARSRPAKSRSRPTQSALLTSDDPTTSDRGYALWPGVRQRVSRSFAIGHRRTTEPRWRLLGPSRSSG